MSKFQIVPLQDGQYQNWRKLYQGYADYYQVALTDKGVAETWSWLMSADHPVSGLVVLDGQKLIGLAHYRAMPSPLRGAEIGFLDDLFVAPDARGQRVGALILDALKSIARDKGWPVIRWITRDHNYQARTLYDQHAKKTDWNTYEMMPEEMMPD